MEYCQVVFICDATLLKNTGIFHIFLLRCCSVWWYVLCIN